MVEPIGQKEPRKRKPKMKQRLMAWFGTDLFCLGLRY